MTESRPALRWCRALLLAVVAFGGGALAHAASGGLMPGPAATLALLVLATAISARLLGRPASTAKVVLLVVGGQAAVHAALTALAGHQGAPAVPAVAPVAAAPPERTGSLFDQTMPATRPTELQTPAWVAHLVADFSGPHALMAAGHLVAAGLVGLWLASGERALWAVLSMATRPPLPAAPALPALVRLWVVRVDSVPVRRVRVETVMRRGPPYSFGL